MNESWQSRPPLEQVGPVRTQCGKAVHGTVAAGAARIPLVVYAGVADGAVLYVQALQHGLELNGTDVMRRLIQTLDPGRLRGTLILVPMANPLAARVHMQSFPCPDLPNARGLNDMNRRWFSRSTSANFADRQVRALQPIVAMADAMIDLHCHEYLYTPMVLTDMTTPVCADFALAMGFPFVNDSRGVDGMFGPYCRQVLGKPVATVEMPPLRRVDRRNSELGFRGVLNALRHVGMLDGEPELPEEMVVFSSENARSQTFTAEREGFMARHCEPGDAVDEGQVLAEVWAPDDFTVAQTVKAPFPGRIVSMGRPPRYWGDPEQDFVNIGDRLVTVRTPSRVVRGDAAGVHTL